MSFIKFLPLLSCLFVFTLGLFVLAKKSPKAIKIIFFLFCLVVSVWLFGTFMMFRTTEDYLAIFWDRFIYAGVVFVPALMHHFSLLFTKRKNQRLLLYINYGLAFIFLFLSQTKYFVDGLFYYPWGVHTKAQFFHHLFLLSFFFFVFFLFYNIYTFYKTQASPLEKTQSKYVLLAFGLLIGIGAFAYLPAYGISIYPFSFISGVLFTLVLSYAILRHRFMDIRIAVKNTFIYLSSIIGSLTLTFLLWLILNNFTTIPEKEKIITILVFALVSFKPINQSVEKFSKKFLFYTIYNYQETIRSLSETLIKMIELDKIVDSLVDKIMDIMKLERGGVLLINQENGEKKYKIQKVIGFNQENGISLVKDSFLTQYLEKLQKPLLLDELSLLANETFSQEEKENFTRLQRQMKKIEAALCLPLINNNQLIGIIVLGNKISNSAYTNEDLELLETLSNQMAVAIGNARLYKQVQDFNKNLQEKVDDQTKDIKRQSQHLQELLDVKNDFLRVANHQLNTPLSVVRNALSMMADNTFTKEQAMPAIQNGFDRLNSVIGDFLKAYDLEGEKMTMKPEPVDIALMIEKLLPEKKNLQLAVERKLKLSIEKPKFKVPLVFCDPKQIINVISNLLDNAVFYTNKGSVTVTYSMPNTNHLLVSVIDTGAGISDEDKKSMFQKFVRGKGATQLHPDGSGLGLYIAKKIIEGNNGEINVISQGLNKGSVFSFTLPIYKNQATDQKPYTSRDQKVIIFKENIKNNT
jgi:signal transduction histidine kinase